MNTCKKMFYLSYNKINNILVNDSLNTVQSNTLSTTLPSIKSTFVFKIIERNSFSLIQLFLILKSISYLDVSYNQPKLNEFASWSANAITFANISIDGPAPNAIFVNTNNTIYTLDRANGSIQVWSNDSINLTRTISGNFSSSYSLFVTTNGDIYVDNEYSNGRVDKLTLNENTSVPVMYVDDICYGLFVDISNTLYCSMETSHKVVSKSLNDISNMTSIAAGTGCSGSTPNTLSSPTGIFVNTNFDLYVADTNNSRIQLFQLGQLKWNNKSRQYIITYYHYTQLSNWNCPRC